MCYGQAREKAITYSWGTKVILVEGVIFKQGSWCRYLISMKIECYTLNLETDWYAKCKYL